MKKIISLLLAVLVLVPLTAFGSAPAVKIGVILVHDDNTGYDFAHISGIKTAAAALGISEDQIIWKYNISEDEGCYDTATDLVEQGCTYIFSDSYGHQSYMQQAASENPTRFQGKRAKLEIFDPVEISYRQARTFVLKFYRLFPKRRGPMMKQDIVPIENTRFIEILLHYRGVTN